MLDAKSKPTVLPRSSFLASDLFAVQHKPSKESIKEKRATLKRTVAECDIHTDPNQWWLYEDEFLRNEMDWYDYLLETDQLKFESGKMSLEQWKTSQKDVMKWKAQTQNRISETFKMRQDAMKIVHQHAAEGPSYLQISTGYAELLVEFCENRESRSFAGQHEFRQTCINAYGSRRLPDRTIEIWDPVFGEYVDPDLMTAAHITPFFLEKKIMEDIFEQNAHDEIFSPANGLMLRDYIEKKFDQHLLVIVPIEPEVELQVPSDGYDSMACGSIQRWKICVVDDDTKKKQIPTIGAGLAFADLDGRELNFVTQFRPRARYLYYHYVIALLRARRHRRKGWLLQQSQDIAWPNPGKYIRKTMLRTLIASVGHKIPEQEASEADDVEEEVMAAFQDSIIPDQVSENSYIGGKFCRRLSLYYC